MQSIVFVNPFTNTENAYISRQIDMVARCGYEPRPLCLTAVLMGRCGGLWARENTVMVHWLENRVFKVGVKSRGVSIRGLAEFLAYTAILITARARVVHVVHDHEVHDVKDSLRWLSRAAVRLLRWVADARVVHDPSFAEHYGAHYLPHPLYSEPVEAPPPHDRDVPHFAAMGAIRPYKRLAEVLDVWPPDAPLLIAGRGDGEYVARLHEIVARRGLAGNVAIQDRFLSDAEFFDTLGDQDVLLLPHREGANLVSGAFFAGVGRVRMVLARRSPFIDWVASQADGVMAFENDSRLADAVEDMLRRWNTLRDVDLTTTAVDLFGDAACERAYRAFLAQQPQVLVPEGRH
ncbi:hypothetical protein [Demequina sp. NBRC 110055]|uniref:hypothetical protein n=1 Tax=Demequina sp. NBRC 110055 TaxID=1570344 RepID=UPI000A06A37C|nr:hypothetical protein [Demequina sp. NBRC 110055]